MLLVYVEPREKINVVLSWRENIVWKSQAHQVKMTNFPKSFPLACPLSQREGQGSATMRLKGSRSSRLHAKFLSWSLSVVRESYHLKLFQRKAHKWTHDELHICKRKKGKVSFSYLFLGGVLSLAAVIVVHILWVILRIFQNISSDTAPKKVAKLSDQKKDLDGQSLKESRYLSLRLSSRILQSMCVAIAAR